MSDIRARVKAQFGAHAQNYVTSADHVRSDSLDQLLARVDPQPGWRMLDIATGGGHTALAFAPRVREVIATDLTPAILSAAEAFIRGRGATNVSFREADAMDLPFADAEFDLVTCRVAPHHFPDCARFAREMQRVLKPGGTAALVDNIVPADPLAARFINAFEKLRDPSHNWAYTQADWLDFFTAASLPVVHSEIFRKVRDLDSWASMLSVDDRTRLQLRALLRHAPAAARAALSPEFDGAQVRFYLTEILIVARRPHLNPA